MTTTEAALTRKFGISFIDARSIVTEAKLTLDIHTYPTRDQKELLLAEASNIFESYSEEVRASMQTNRMHLEEAKLNGSTHSMDLSIGGRSMSGSSHHRRMSSSSNHSTSSVKSASRFILKR